MTTLKKIKKLIYKLFKAIYLVPIIYEIFLESHYQKRRKTSRNPFLRSFRRYSIFSQSDEDSIIDEITKRIGIEKGIFIELGVGDGTQNNTLSLLAQGWKGLWIGNEEIVFKPGKNLKFVKSWITKDNINAIISSNLYFLNNEMKSSKNEIDLLSIDLDGNDFYIWEAVLSSGFEPKIIIAEYNGTLGPRANWRMRYEPSNNWKSRNDNYFGASFLSLVKLFKKYNYFPLCCNSDTGVNLFLVRREFLNNFKEIEFTNLIDIYEPPHYALSIFSKTHNFSLSTLHDITGERD